MDRAGRDDLQSQLARVADGDRDAFHPVFVRAWPVIRKFVGRYLGPEDAEDAAQEVLVRLFRRASEFDPRRDALSWVLGIAAFEVKTIARKRYRRREAPLEGSPEVADAADDPEQALLARDRQETLLRALATLPALDAETLVALAEGRPPTTVAPATFRKRVQRAFDRLRKIVGVSHGGQ